MNTITPTFHTFIGLIIGMLLLVTPWLFGFHEVGGVVVAIPLIIGAFTILNELVTSSHASPIHIVPMRLHLVLDFILGATLVVSPWLFEFSSQPLHVWLPHVFIGAAIITYTTMTQPADEREPVLS